MAILSNVPTLSYIYIKDMLITYNDQTYQIPNTYTCKSFIYWDYNDPYNIVTSNTVLKEMAGRFYIIFNSKGVPTIVPQTEITISFSEYPANDLVTERVIGLQQQNVENGTRFTTIETNIDGIKTSIGQVQESITGNSEKISQLEQTTNGISASVSAIEKEYREDSDAKLLRDNISIAILDLQSILGVFSSDMNSYMEDNKLSEIELEEISAYKEKVENSKLTLNSQLDIILSALQANGQTDKVTTLTTQKDLLNNSIDGLISVINNACMDNIFTNSEITAIISYFGNVNSKINETKNLIDDYIFLGVGGNLIEEIANLIIRQNQIKLNVTKTESIIKNSLNLSKSLVQGIIDSNNTALINFKNCFSTIAEDREIISEEIDSLNIRINNMDNQITYITNKKDEIINNTMLSDGEKNKLADAYNSFIESYNSMKNKVNEVMIDGKINDVELLEVNESVNTYYDKLNNIHARLCQALDNIENNTTNKAILDAKSELQVEINELDNKINNLETDFDETILSGYIDKQEKEKILQNLEILEREKIDIDNMFDEWYNSDFLYGNLKETYKQTYDNYIDKYNTLSNLSTTVANKTDLVTDEERLAIENAVNELLISLDLFYKQSNIVIDVTTSNKISYEKDTLSQDFNDINNILNDLNNQMNESFKDGIITEIELKNIETILAQIDKEKLDIDKTYDEIYNNTNLK